MSITYDFKGQVALVTGAASGMGLATARAFAQAKAAVTLADVSEAALQRAVNEIKSAGGKAIGVVCDVSDEAQVAAMVERTVATFSSARLTTRCALTETVMSMWRCTAKAVCWCSTKTASPSGRYCCRDEGHNPQSTSMAIKPDTNDLYIVTNDGNGGQGATIFHAKVFAKALPHSHR